MSNSIISVENLGKRYTIGHESGERYLALRDVVARNARGLWNKTKDLVQGKPVIAGDTHEEIWALRNVSFEVKRGEVIGIIGRNGAGKSTLLKILSRISEPTEGRAVIRGRVASLLEVGTGFHPELTGRENIYLNGSILGMTRKEIDRKFDEIVDFSGVEKFIDTPVKRYSSGMSVRLGFAVAAHVEPEILIVDEVLAVGDFEFQRRCLGKMNQVALHGRTVLFVSHNMAALEALCTTALLLEGGSVSIKGDVRSTIAQYSLPERAISYDASLHDHPNRAPGSTPALRSVTLRDDAGRTLDAIFVGRPLTFYLVVHSEERLIDATIGIHVYDTNRRRVMTCNSRYQSQRPLAIEDTSHVQCRLNKCQLMPGRYSITLALAAQSRSIDRIEEALQFDVVPMDFYGTGRLVPDRDGVFLPDAEWIHDVEPSRLVGQIT